MRLKIDYVSAFDDKHFDTEEECREHIDDYIFYDLLKDVEIYDTAGNRIRAVAEFGYFVDKVIIKDKNGLYNFKDVIDEIVEPENKYLYESINDIGKYVYDMDEDMFLREELSLEDVMEKMKDLGKEDSLVIKKTDKGYMIG